MEGAGTNGLGQCFEQGARQVFVTSSPVAGASPQSVEAQVRNDSQWFGPTEKAGKPEPSRENQNEYPPGELANSNATCNHAIQGTHVDASPDARSVDEEVHEHHEELAQEGIREISTTALLNLLEQQDGKCAISGRPLSVDNVALDHIAAFSESNDHSVANVQLVTEEVNRAKGCMGMQEFIDLCHDVTRTHPETLARWVPIRP